MLIFQKKGMSPLIATMLLIAFAVSLGILIMSLGKQMQHGEEGLHINASEICGKAKFQIANIGDHPSICFDKEAGLIKFTGTNRGNHAINSMQMWVIGKKLYTIEVLDDPMHPNIPLEKQVEYDAALYGTIRKIQFIPRVEDHSMKQPLLCVDYPIEYSDIQLC